MAFYHSNGKVTNTHTYTRATQSQSQKGKLPSSSTIAHVLLYGACSVNLLSSGLQRGTGVSADSTNIWGEELSHCLELSCRVLLHLWTTFIRETQTRPHPFLKSLGWGRHRVPWKEEKPPRAHVLFVDSFFYSILQRESFEHIDNCVSALLPRKPKPPADRSQGCPLIVAVDPGSFSEYGSCYHCFIEWQFHCPWSKSRVPLISWKEPSVLLWNSSS